MLKLPLMRKPKIVVSLMDGRHLGDAAAIHAAGFREAWGDGTLANLIGQRGMTGLVAGAPGERISGFLIYRTVLGEVEVITIATAPKGRRKGVARALMDEMIRRSLADRCEAIFLEVDENNTAARGLYARLGFRKVGERKGYYRGEARPGEAALASNALILRLDLKN